MLPTAYEASEARSRFVYATALADGQCIKNELGVDRAPAVTNGEQGRGLQLEGKDALVVEEGLGAKG